MPRLPLLFIFYEAVDIPRQRRVFECGFQMPMVENRFHPPHQRHGLVKYDAGPIVVSLNQASPNAHDDLRSDAMVAVIEVTSDCRDLSEFATCKKTCTGDVLWTDFAGHHYILSAKEKCASGKVSEVRLTVSNFAETLHFYRDVLGLPFCPTADDKLLFSTPSVDLRMECNVDAPDGRPPRHDNYLLVLYAHPIQAAFDELCEQGISFSCAKPTFSAIGGTARFMDPSGHVYCLYDPSDECLTWESGEKIQTLIARAFQVSASKANKDSSHVNEFATCLSDPLRE